MNLFKSFIFVDSKEALEKISSLVLHCQDALSIEHHCQELIKSAILFEDLAKTHVISTPYLLVIEKQLLSLASYENCTDGILYGLPLIFEFNGEMILYIRSVKFPFFFCFTGLNYFNDIKYVFERRHNTMRKMNMTTRHKFASY